VTRRIRPGQLAVRLGVLALALSVLAPWGGANLASLGATAVPRASATSVLAAAAGIAASHIAPLGAATPGADNARGRPVDRHDVDGSPLPSGPAAAGTAAAVDGLDVATAATYVLDPAARRVRVSVDVTVVNRLSDTLGLRYYYPGVNLAIQPEAASIAASQDGVRDQTTTAPRTGYRLLSVEFSSRLYAGAAAHVQLSYVLPAGAPRSTSSVRVGAAYSTFVAWAFGDRGTVEVDVPSAFEVTTSGGTLAQSSRGDGTHVLTASVAAPGTWYAWIDARDDAALTSQTLHLPGNEQVVVRAWPEDAVWRQRVARELSRGIPVLLKEIDLPWPVDGRLTVIEVSGTLLEGYAGFYSAGTHEITISENLDPLTIVHEASHAWFNASLFTDRWITEGLANEYASRTLKATGLSPANPGDARTSASVAFPLDTWGPPAPIKTSTQDAREQWAYDASWTVIREVVAEVGVTGMAKVFAAAAADATAYAGAGPPEKSTLPNDWRRFVDLAEEVGGGTGIAQMIAPWALTPSDRAELVPRAAARTAYHSLVAADAGWAAPAVVRMDLDGWDFAAADAAISAASAVLRDRDAIRSGATVEKLSVPASLEAAYEDAATASALSQAARDEAGLRAALSAVAAADSAVSAPRDGLVELGLLGSDPASELAAARSAWQAGDAATARQEASAALSRISVAADAGRLRLVAIAAAILAVALLAAVLTAARRRVRRAGRTADAPPGSAPLQAVPDPSPILPASATGGAPPEPTPDGQDEGAE
jgi:hypothetical protein